MSNLDILALLTTIVMLVCVYMTVKQYLYSWVPNIIACVMLMFYYYETGFYAQVMLQVAFLLQCFYGFFNWKKDEDLVVNNIKNRYLILHIIGVLILGLSFAYLFEPKRTFWYYIDGITAFLGLLANFYLTRKIIQSWLLWMFFNFTLVNMFFASEMYIMSALNVILFIQSVMGYQEWKKDLRTV